MTRIIDLFHEVQRGLPRQGPGDSTSSKIALQLCSELPDEPSILDIGCGPGLQTLVIAKASQGSIVAVDTCEEYLDLLRGQLEGKPYAHRVTVTNADMSTLPFPPETFDLIWSEGAAYLMGVGNALRSWRPMLREKGYLAFTELVWLDDQPPPKASEFFAGEYPEMTSVEAVHQSIRNHGYRPVGNFTLPDAAWWDDYYTPLEAKLPVLRQKYVEDEEALGIIGMSQAEIDMRRLFSESYGYQFFIARKLTP